jgi:hypothetical protein
LLNDTLKNLRASLKAFNLAGMDISNTDRVFVAPVLNQLGWAMSDISETVSGYSIDETLPSISYAFFSEGQPIFLVDTKPLLSDMDTPKKLFQAAEQSPVQYLAISNGARWYIYNVETEKRLALIIDIENESAEEKLNLLSKTNIKNKFLEQYLQSNPVPVQESPKTELKTRGYGTSDETHHRLVVFRRNVGTSVGKYKGEPINNSVICEALLQVFLDAADKGFDYANITNRAILKGRIIDCLLKNLAGS